ncbi:ATP-binding protein [Methylobacterium organophilum]|uniref:ATP-binding protein n=1 Tax=Methylobacterium organophilum TaxID=410 RepID=UPI001F13F43C|nr:ATP-binding protein [Methylobacterium organophilum]UMY17117.1 ATP-binding protein [Methylobacterium organophilum]
MPALDPNDPFARVRAALGDESVGLAALMELVQATYLGLDRDTRLARNFKELLLRTLIRRDPALPHGPANTIEARGILVVGESGAGKSHALKRILSRHPAFPGYGDPTSDCQAITVHVTSPSTFIGLGRRTLRATGYPAIGKLENHEIWSRVYERLEMRKIFVVHFEEMHNVFLTAHSDDLKDILNTLKTLMTLPTWPVIVIISGLPCLQAFLHQSDEDRRRLRIIEFDSMSLPADVEMMAAMATKLAGIAELRVSADLTERIVPRLIHAALYQVGTAIELIHEAILNALTDDRPASVVQLANFANAYAARTACGPLANPFLASDWATLDCSLVMQKKPLPPDPEDEVLTSAKTARRAMSRGRR